MLVRAKPRGRSAADWRAELAFRRKLPAGPLPGPDDCVGQGPAARSNTSDDYLFPRSLVGDVGFVRPRRGDAVRVSRPKTFVSGDAAIGRGSAGAARCLCPEPPARSAPAVISLPGPKPVHSEPLGAVDRM